MAEKEPEKEARIGLVQIYTGHGKGKTTAAFGLALRAIGQGYKVIIIQFMKNGGYSGEYIAMENHFPDIEITQFGKTVPNADLIKAGKVDYVSIDSFKPSVLDKPKAKNGMAFAEMTISSGKYDLVILDEIMNALRLDLVTVDEVIRLVKEKPPHTEIVMTGRTAPIRLVEMADLVTEMKEIKHPFQAGFAARRGIDF